MPVPLTDAGTARVGKDDTADLLEDTDLTVTRDGSTNLLGSGGDSELALGAETVIVCFLGDRCSPRHVLVRRVRARTNESDLELRGPAILLNSSLEFRERSGKIGSERTVDVGLELGKVLG